MYLQFYIRSIFSSPSCVYLTDQAPIYSSFNHTIGILAGFMGKGWECVEAMSAASPEDVKGIIDDYECVGTLELAQTLFSVATAIQTKHDGLVPQTKQGLQGIGVEEPVLSLMMQQVYGSSELIVSLHTRRTLVALDMVDWEESAAEKSAVKMAKLTTEKVRKSLRTWLPKGESANFHDTMDSIGTLLSARKAGDWGRIQSAIQSHFSAKEKDALLGMIEAICQFYKATKGRGKKKSVGAPEEF
jgi:endonuclease III